MFARGELRNDAPIRHVGEDLREHHARENLLAIADYRSRSFVAGTLNAQYERVGHDDFILTAAPSRRQVLWGDAIQGRSTRPTSASKWWRSFYGSHISELFGPGLRY